MVDPAIKYGAGDEDTRELLTEASRMVVGMESLETELAVLSSKEGVTDDIRQKISEIEEEQHYMRQERVEKLRNAIKFVEQFNRGE
jgi:translation elongation factor EF-1beta